MRTSEVKCESSRHAVGGGGGDAAVELALVCECEQRLSGVRAVIELLIQHMSIAQPQIEALASDGVQRLCGVADVALAFAVLVVLF